MNTDIYIEKDGALERRFQTVMVEPPSQEQTVLILKGLRDRYESHHRVQYTDDALAKAVEFSSRYITGRCLPDKAIDVIDEAGARIRLKSMVHPAGPERAGRGDRAAQRRQEKRRSQQDFEKAAGLARPGRQAQEEKESLTRGMARQGPRDRRRCRRRRDRRRRFANDGGPPDPPVE